MLTNTELVRLMERAAVALQVPAEHKPKDIQSIIADLLIEANARKEH